MTDTPILEKLVRTQSDRGTNLSSSSSILLTKASSSMNPTPLTKVALQKKVLFQAQQSNLEDETTVVAASMRTNLSDTNEILQSSNNTKLIPEEFSKSLNTESVLPDARRPLVIDIGTPSYNTENSTPTDTTTFETKSLQANKTSPSRISNAKAPAPHTRAPSQLETTTQPILQTASHFESLQDDFFSLYTPSFEPELRKKKKKKVKKAKREQSIEYSATVSSDLSDINSEAKPVKSQEIINNRDTLEFIDKEPEFEETVVLQSKKSPLDVEGSEKDLLNLDAEAAIKSPLLPKRTVESLDSVNVVHEFTNNKKRKKSIDHSARAVKIPSFTSYKTETESISDDLIEDDLMKKLKTNMLPPASLNRQQTSMSTNSEDSATLSTPTSDRIYNLIIISNLPGSETQTLNVRSKGSKHFQSIIRKTLSYLVTSNHLKGEYLEMHQPSQIIMLWKKTHQISPHMKPDHLNIPPNPDGSETIVEFDLYTHFQAEDLQREKLEQIRLEKLQKQKDKATEDFLTQLQRQKEEEEQAMLLEQNQHDENDLLNEDDLMILTESKDFKNEDSNKLDQHTKINETKDQVNKETEDGYFKILLKSLGNEKLTVQVNMHTRLKKVSEYFLEKKGLPLDSKIRFVFDDEELDLDLAVGDTELEEDFTIDVYIDK